MPLPASGALSLLAIRDELEPGNGSALNLNFYRGRTYSVSGGGQRTISNAPAFSEFYSLQRVSYRLDSVSIVRQSGGTASLAISFDGGFYRSTLSSNVRSFAYNWVTGAAASLYQLRVSSVTDDGFSSDSGIGVWLPLSSTRIYSRSGGQFDRRVSALYEIQEISSGLVVVSANIELQSIGIA